MSEPVEIWMERMRLLMEAQSRALKIFADGGDTSRLARQVMLTGSDLERFQNLLEQLPLYLVRKEPA